MKPLEKILLGAVVGLIALGVFAVTAFAPARSTGDTLGGSIFNRLVSFDEGIAVDGVTVIDGSGNYDGAITSTTGTFSSTLTVTGATALNGGLTMDTDKFIVADTSGNTTIGGTFTLTGLASIAGGLTADSGVFTIADTTGNIYTGGTLTVTGASTLAGNSVMSGSLNLAGAGVLSSTLTVAGESNLSTLVFGGGAATLASDGDTTLTATQICDNAYFGLDPATTAGATVTTDTAANLIADCVPASGDTKILFFENLADASEPATIAAGSNIDLIEPSGGDVVLQQNEDARFEIINVDGTTVKIIVTSLQAAD